VLFRRASERLPIPGVLIFLAVGMLAGSEGIGGVAFEDYELAFRIGVGALVLILFDAALNTPAAAVRAHLAPAGLLATVGVLATAGLIALAAHLLGYDWPTALVLGAIVSPTDAAAVFSLLRNSGVSLKRRVGMTLELESGLNDPTAVILTTILTANLAPPHEVLGWGLPLHILREIAIGVLGGLGVGYGGRWILSRVQLGAGGLNPVFTIALALLAFSVPSLLKGSGFLAVYVAGLILGNGPLPYRGSLARVHDALAWLGQVAMFLVLGLLVFPSRLVDVAAIGLVLAVILGFAARPLAVALCLLPFGFSLRETFFIGWVGIRGAVPIVLATIPVLSQVEGAEWAFNLVFFMVVVNAIVPGTTVGWVSRRLDLAAPESPTPPATVEIESPRPMSAMVRSFYVDSALAVAGANVADLPLPEGSAVTLIARNEDLLAPNASSRLEVGDHVYVLMRPEDEPIIRLMFGSPEEEA
jgi:potassium/hydrogen antiporter